VSPTAASRLCRLSQDLVCPVALSPLDFRPYFTSRWRILCSVRSRYLFTIGLESYLALADRCLPNSQGISNPCYSGASARLTGLQYGAFTLSRAPFQGTSRRRSDAESQSNTTSVVRPSVWAVPRSPAVTDDITLFSFPAGTEMFQFPAFPIARSNCGGDSHSETLSSSPPCGSLRLFAAWHVLRRRSSRAIHQVA
jgi:hypothetical protein